MTVQEKIEKIQRLFLSNDAANWELAASLIESQQLRELYPYVIWHQGALSHAQKLEYLQRVAQNYTIAKVGRTLAGRIWAIADEMMEFLKHNYHPTAFIEVHQRGENMMYRVQTVLPQVYADRWKTRLEYYNNRYDRSTKRLAYMDSLKLYRSGRWWHVNDEVFDPDNADGWLAISSKTSEPIQYDLKIADDENTQLSILVWLPFSSCRSYKGLYLS